MATYTTPRRGTPPGIVDPRRTARPGPKDPRPGPKDPRTRPVTAPRHTRPFAEPATRPKTKPAAKRPATGGIRARRPRAPFILLLVGLLGGALVSLLFISTTLAEGSYRITNLQQQNASLARQEQVLSQQVAQESSPTQIAAEAEAFGMRQNPSLQFINTKTGKIVKGQVSKADSEIDVPGYTP